MTRQRQEEGLKISDSIYVVMPAYNEENNIEKTVKEWYAVLDGKNKASKLVIADSGSTDSTHDILEKLQKCYPQLKILSDTGRQHGPKLIALYNYAIANGADYIFQTDSDGQTNADEFDAFWKCRNEYDAILGKRSVRGDGRQRAFVEHVVCVLLRLYFKVNVPDANAPFRLMRSDVVEKYMSRFDADYNIPNIMLTTFFAFYKEKLIFKEISFEPRTGGTSSINIFKIVKIGWNAIGDFRKFKRSMVSGNR